MKELKTPAIYVIVLIKFGGRVLAVFRGPGTHFWKFYVIVISCSMQEPEDVVLLGPAVLGNPIQTLEVLICLLESHLGVQGILQRYTWQCWVDVC